MDEGDPRQAQRLQALTDAELISQLLTSRQRAMYWDESGQIMARSCERELFRRSQPAELEPARNPPRLARPWWRFW